MAETRAQSNRRIRQEALRAQLESQGHVQHVIDILSKVEKPSAPLESIDIQRYKLIVDTKLKLINKYLPDLKSIEIVDEDGNDALPKSITINVVGTSDKHTGNT
jgi:hypothetical protein